MRVYYNDNDPHCCAWLKELMKAGLIASGEVDCRSICDVKPDEVKGFDRCHFFAGIGGWEYALQLAGWPDDRPVWTGSCPCQAFSVAGKQKGIEDHRDLWPHFFRLISERRPDAAIGEQVPGAIGHGWLDRVSTDLETIDYAVGSVVLGAHSVGAPHIRQRLYWVADSEGIVINGTAKCRRDPGEVQEAGAYTGTPVGRSGSVSGLEYATGNGWEQGRAESNGGSIASGCVTGGMGNTNDEGLERLRGYVMEHGAARREGEERHGAASGFWSDYEFIPCGDGKARRLKPGIVPLVDGLPKGMGRVRDSGMSFNEAEGRVMRLRGYGNAIVAPLAAKFIRAYMEVRDGI